MDTAEFLLHIGFERVRDDNYRIDLGNYSLSAVLGLGPNFSYGYHFVGSHFSQRVASFISFTLPVEVSSFEEGGALMSYFLRRNPPDPEPAWFVEGLSNRHLLPGLNTPSLIAIESVSVDDRIIKLTLSQIKEILKIDTCLQASIYFDGSLLTIKIGDKPFYCNGVGKIWKHPYFFDAAIFGKLPKRMPRSPIGLKILDDYSIMLHYHILGKCKKDD